LESAPAGPHPILRRPLAWALVLLAVACGDPPPTPVSVPEDFASDATLMDLLQRLEAEAVASPGSAAAHMKLGLALAANEADALAAPSFENARQLDPTDPEIPYQLAALAGRQGRFEEQASLLREVLAMDDSFHFARYDLGCVLLDLGEFDEADAAFETMVLREASVGLAKLGRGLVALERGEGEAALAFLEDAGERLPGEPYVQFQIGSAYTMLGRKGEAAEARGAVEVFRGRPELVSPGSREAKGFLVSRASRLSRANKLINDSNPHRAIPVLKKLHAEDPNDFESATSLAAAYIAAQRPEEALAVVETCVAADPDHELPHIQRAAALLGLAAKLESDAQREHLERARLSAANATTLAPDSARAYVELARTLAALRRDEEAVGAYRSAIERGDKSELLYREMMAPAERYGGALSAVSILREGIDRGADRLELRFQLCGALLRAGRGDESRREQREMVRLAPGHSLTQRADQILTRGGY
ncbi:MAG: tetratricopeptide repeat protein, partial [Planctomycetota bacterium]